MMFRSWKRVCLAGVLLGLCAAHAAAAVPLQTVLQSEAGYIVDCSFTERATHHAGALPTADAYGAINDVRIFQSGPNWVRPGEGAVGAVGLMEASEHLGADAPERAAYDHVLAAFFRNWILEKKQPWNTDQQSADSGLSWSSVNYDVLGHRTGAGAPASGVTGMLLCAMWKYANYLRDTHQDAARAAWLDDAWPRVRSSADAILKTEDTHRHLLHARAGMPDLWISDSALGAAGLKCAAAWAATLHKPGDSYWRLAATQITEAVSRMRDTNGFGFFKMRQAASNYGGTYYQSVDQLCFLPFEIGLINANDPFVETISNRWTNGWHGIAMTAEAHAPADWRTFGTHWHWEFKGAPANMYLYPGPGLQLAKMEWKAGTARHDPELLARARRRLEWAQSRTGSDLWMGASKDREADVPGGIVDWRDSQDRAHTAQRWERFVDTSAYMIQVSLMVDAGKDMSYVP